MSISIQFHPNDQTENILRTAADKRDAVKEQKQGGLVFMGDLNLGQDQIESTLNRARKQAYKLVSDAWDTDKNFEKSLRELRSFVAETKEEKYAARDDIAAAQEAMDGIREEYQVDPASQEQKDLDWYNAYRKHQILATTKEEAEANIARANEIEANLTEYQSRMLEADDRLTDAQKRYDEAEIKLKSARQSITDAESEHEKQHAMRDAKDEGEAIMDAAAQEVIGMVMNDAKDHLDEQVKEAQEKKEEKEEEEAKEEKIEEQRAEQAAIREALIEGAGDAVLEVKARSERANDELDPADMLDMDPTKLVKTNGSQLEAALDDLKNKLALIDNDLKGLKVDEAV